MKQQKSWPGLEPINPPKLPSPPRRTMKTGSQSCLSHRKQIIPTSSTSQVRDQPLDKHWLRASSSNLYAFIFRMIYWGPT